MRGTVQPILDKYGVAFRIFHGYGSATSVHSAAEDSLLSDAPLKVFYLGDYDPSGLHMSMVDLPERIAKYGGEIEIVRLALDKSDIKDRNLPSFPLSDKTGDPRQNWYQDTTKLKRCWELDALNPVVLRDRLESAIRSEILWPDWNRVETCGKAEMESLNTYLKAWGSLAAAVKSI